MNGKQRLGKRQLQNGIGGRGIPEIIPEIGVGKSSKVFSRIVSSI